MPHMPGEEKTEEHIFDKVAKESDDSTASDHPIQQKATAQDHQSKGPQLSDSELDRPMGIVSMVEGSADRLIDLGEPKSKEELQAEAKKLNE
jgi:hypothetical protein